MRKFPVFLLVDVSESMVGDALAQLEQGIRKITADLLQDPYALETVWMSVIGFAGRARTLVPLTEITDFIPPHLPVGGGTALGAALIHLMDEIDRGVTVAQADRKGDWRPLVFLITDGHPTDDPEPAIRRWQKKYADRVSLVAVSIGGGGDRAVLGRLTDQILPFDDTVDGSFQRFITWITNSVKSSTRSVAAGAGISLTKMEDDLAGNGYQGMPFDGIDDRYAIFVGKCGRSKAPYVVKYERHLGRYDTNDPKLAALFSTRDYALKLAVPVQGDYFELTDNDTAPTSVHSSQLIGQPNCPHCGATFGMAMCGCGGIHCVSGDGEATCPWCDRTGNYGSSQGGPGFDISRGKG